MTKVKMTMLVLATLVLGVALAGLSTGESAEPQTAMQVLEENSCAIACPGRSAYPNQRGEVSCKTGYTPLCQCADPDKPAASCEPPSD